ncbi:unnamed protein product [Rotaria sp. Silwood1]|nr:unnamed protein product [Rotaria sp. Silwood1]
MKLKVKKSSLSSLSILLTKYLIELGEYRAAERYLKSLIRGGVLENDPSLASAQNCLGLIYSKRGIHGGALKHYKRALNSQVRLEYSNNNALAEIYNNIGYSYLIGLRDIDVALQNFDEAERIQLREPDLTREHLASIYCNIGQAYFIKNDDVKAQEYFEKSYQIYEQDSKKKIKYDALEHSLMKADLCVHYGHLLNKLINTFDDAQDKYDTALKIYENILITTHPKLMNAYMIILSDYAIHKAYEKIIETYEKKDFKVLINNYTESQQNLANLHFLIGACYVSMEKYDEGVNVWQNAILYEKKQHLDQNLSTGIIDLPSQLMNRAYRKAFNYYNTESNNDLFNCGILSSKLFNYDDAIKYLKSIESQTINQNIIRSIILGDMYLNKEQFNSAIIEYHKALNQIETQETNDLLRDAINLLIIQCTDNNNKKLYELIQIENSLMNNDDTDYNTISMKVIIYYEIAQTYLNLGEYEDARLYSNQSIKLKSNYFSSYHLSLVKDYLLIAKSYFDEKKL